MKKKVKRSSVLFVRIKEKNKKYVEKEAKKNAMNSSEFMDALIEKERTAIK